MERALWGLGPEDVLAVQNSIYLVSIVGLGAWRGKCVMLNPSPFDKWITDIGLCLV